jgi:hypothetical protein
MNARTMSIGLLLVTAATATACSRTVAAPPPSPLPKASASVSITAAPPTSAPAAPTSAAAKPAQPSNPLSPAAPASAGRVAIYQPSTVITESAHLTLLHTSHGVSQVNSFYERQFSQGWTVVHYSTSAYGGMFDVRNAATRSTVTILGTHAGTSISISTY